MASAAAPVAPACARRSRSGGLQSVARGSCSLSPAGPAARLHPDSVGLAAYNDLGGGLPAAATQGREGSVAGRQAKKANGNEPLGFEQKLWAAADKMRGHMDPAEHKHVVLGLIFL